MWMLRWLWCLVSDHASRETISKETRYADLSPKVFRDFKQNNHYMHIYETKRGPEDVPLVEFLYLVFTRMPGESYRRRLRSLLLYLCYVFRALINSLACWLYTLVQAIDNDSIDESKIQWSRSLGELTDTEWQCILPLSRYRIAASAVDQFVAAYKFLLAGSHNNLCTSHTEISVNHKLRRDIEPVFPNRQDEARLQFGSILL